MKFSKQRKLILDTVLENKVHPTADFIYEHLKKENPNLSLGTVYRNLSQLVDHGFITKVSIPGQPDRFDVLTSDHCHLLCTNCNDIYDIESKIIENIPNKLSEELDIKITSSNIIFRGICKTCNENKL